MKEGTQTASLCATSVLGERDLIKKKKELRK